MPAARALAMTRSIACTVTTGPNAWSASISTVAAVSRSTVMRGRGFMEPLSTARL